MKLHNGFMPSEPIKGKRGYYPVSTAEEWDSLPVVYKSMEWFPIEVYNRGLGRKELTTVEYVEFDVTYLKPYACRATVRVHVQEVQKILFCYFGDTDCHLYSISGVVFENGERWSAKWMQDSTTGAFAIYACGKAIGMQGGYMGFIPNQIERVKYDEFKWRGYVGGNRCHTTLTNPFKHI